MFRPGSRNSLDVAAIAACALIWGTTWHAIKLQLGQVDPLISVIYRFSLAAGLLFVWSALRRERLGLTARSEERRVGKEC